MFECMNKYCCVIFEYSYYFSLFSVRFVGCWPMKREHAPLFRNPVVDEERTRPGQWLGSLLWVSFSACLGDRLSIQPIKTCAAYPQRCSSETVNILFIAELTSLESRRDQLSRSFFQDISHPSSSLCHLLPPLHVIHLSCLGSEHPHGLHVLCHPPKNIVLLLITP